LRFFSLFFIFFTSFSLLPFLFLPSLYIPSSIALHSKPSYSPFWSPWQEIWAPFSNWTVTAVKQNSGSESETPNIRDVTLLLSFSPSLATGRERVCAQCVLSELSD
jgi:hypothetical protein